MGNLTCFNVVHYQTFVLSQTKKYQFGMKITEIFIHMNIEVILLQTWRLSKKNHIVIKLSLSWKPIRLVSLHVH
jgi:hypothetical protein